MSTRDAVEDIAKPRSEEAAPTGEEAEPAEGRTVVTFGELTIGYAPSVLPPREWTTAQSEWARELLRDLPDGPILELCTGAGQIGLLAAVLSGRELVAVDMNPVAVECARNNARHAGIAHLVDVRCSGIESAVAEHETFPLVIADPPWVPHDGISQFPEDPPLAIDGGGDGLQLARACVLVIDRHLRPEGAALLQLGSMEQVDQLRRDLASEGQDLAITGHRDFPRGVLVLLERNR